MPERKCHKCSVEGTPGEDLKTLIIRTSQKQSWILLCPTCLDEFRDLWREFMKGPKR